MKVQKITTQGGGTYLRATLGNNGLPTYISDTTPSLLSDKLRTHRALKAGADASKLAARHIVL